MTTNKVFKCKHCGEGFAVIDFIQKHLHEHGDMITGYINENNYQQHYDLVKRSTFIKDWQIKHGIVKN